MFPLSASQPVYFSPFYKYQMQLQDIYGLSGNDDLNHLEHKKIIYTDILHAGKEVCFQKTLCDMAFPREDCPPF